MTNTLLRDLRDRDRVAYLATLLAPADKRSALAAIWSYAHELALIPLTVREAAAGEIRLQWWADVVRGERNEEGKGHPVGAALLHVVDKHALPREPLAMMAEERSFDLYADPMPDRPTFEAYAGATVSVPIQTACRILDPEAANRSANAAGHAGVYQAAMDRLSTLARDRAGGRSFIPADVLLKGWASPANIIDPSFGAQRTDTAAAGQVITEALRYAAEHRVAFVRHATTLPQTVAPAFACAYARTVRERAIAATQADILDRPSRNEPLREQSAVMRTARLFEGGSKPSLLSRLRKRFGGEG